MAKKSTSPWVYVGCGCVTLVVLVAAGIAALGFMGVRFARNFERELKDPEVRQERAREILGAERLPEGYHAQMHFKVPFLFEMVVLSDGAPVDYREDRHQGRLESEDLGDNAFIYMAMPDVGDAREKFEGLREGDTRGLDDVKINLDFRSREILGHGAFDLPPQHLRYVAHRGDFRDEHASREGTYAVVLIDCPGSSKVRAAFYWQRREIEEAQLEAPAAGAPAEDPAQLAGTPYEEGLRRFMSHFHVCGD